MVWVLVCNDMYRYERHFRSYYRKPTILATVSIPAASQRVNTDLIENLFFTEIKKTGYNSDTDESLFR